GPAALLYVAMRNGAGGGATGRGGFGGGAGARGGGPHDGGALRVAAAIEMVHAYSLVHDDLPAMDDDDMRRGKPSCHVAFDEATAILAGDALLTRAFEVLADEETHPSPAIRIELVRALAEAAGGLGMVGGQMIDLSAQHEAVDFELIAVLERMKTGALIAFGCEAGAVLGDAPAALRAMLRAYGYDVGLAFQIVDDLLDVTGEEAVLGKKVGKDAAAGKATFVAALGVEGARREARSLVDRAVARLDGFGPDADALRGFGDYVLQRRS
ncbi:MAG: polyprenyl synthetase family protein, partial [Defluviicoccus sp.]|nr:polyprenyl synthetase family protein [Defluviicoccus sp.]